MIIVYKFGAVQSAPAAQPLIRTVGEMEEQ
jgi:hypothetical protein